MLGSSVGVRELGRMAGVPGFARDGGGAIESDLVVGLSRIGLGLIEVWHRGWVGSSSSSKSITILPARVLRRCGWFCLEVVRSSSLGPFGSGGLGSY